MLVYIDLKKAALHREHLVRKQVQVHGSNGKIFTRMQWVDPNTGKPVHGKFTTKKDSPPNTGKVQHTIEEKPKMTQKQHIDEHVKKLSKEEKYALMEKHGVQHKEHENPQKNHMNAMMALKEHLNSNPHLVGAEHLPKDEKPRTPEGVEKVTAHLQSLDRKAQYELMKKHGISDSDPRDNPAYAPKGDGGDGTGPIRHMKNMMELKKILQGDSSSLPTPEPKQQESKPTPKTKAQEGNHDIKSIIKGMSAQEQYSLMKQHGIADTDPRTVQEFVDNKTAPIRHMRNAMALKDLIEKNPHILNLDQHGGISQQEKNRLASLDGNEKLAKDVSNFIGDMSKELKKKLVEKYKDTDELKNRKRFDNPAIDYMHSVTALKQHFMNNPDKIDEHKPALENEQLKNTKVGNKQMERFLRHEIGLKGVYDVKQEDKHKEWSFGVGNSSFARIERDEKNKPILSIVDTGKDGTEWNEHSVPMEKVKQFLEEDKAKRQQREESQPTSKNSALGNLSDENLKKIYGHIYNNYKHWGKDVTELYKKKENPYKILDHLQNVMSQKEKEVDQWTKASDGDLNKPMSSIVSGAEGTVRDHVKQAKKRGGMAEDDHDEIKDILDRFSKKMEKSETRQIFIQSVREPIFYDIINL